MGRLNKVMLIGNVGNTPEMRYTPSGQQLASINLAVGNKYTNREGVEVDDTQWFNVTVWAQRADFVVNYVKKGMQLYVEGRISGRAYQTDSGETRASLDVNAFEVQIFNDPQSQQSNNQPNPSNFSQPTSISEQPAAQQEPTAQQESAPQQEPTPQQEPEKKDDQLPW
ncbi:MAG: single-stranded DNA-binding protein [Dehalococcoidia bacterium]|jgi:single-strand DNA-binding protein